MTPAPDDDQGLEALVGLLGNETRMAIMRALWADFEFEYYVTESRDGTAFRTLRTRAGIEDSGNFNYHLGRLTGRLVEDREDGYVLSPLGYNLMQAIDRYGSFAYETVEEHVVADPCPYCGGDLVAAYRREILSVRCRGCAGLAADGNFTFVQLPTTGVQHLDADGLLDTATVAMAAKIRSSMHGSCWECRAPMSRTTSVCDGHDRGPDGVCGACGNRYRAVIEARCPTCGTSGHGPVIEYAIVSATVGGWFADRGRGPNAVGPWAYRLGALGAATEVVRSTEPLEVAVTFEIAGETWCVEVIDRPAAVRIRPDDDTQHQ